jgi:integrase
MGIYKRGSTFHMQDFIDGERIRRSLKTGNLRLAKKRRIDIISEIKQGRRASGKGAKQPFKLALEDYLVDRTLTKAAKTVATDRQRGQPLIASFANTRLDQITVENITQYQSKRKRAGVSNRTVNMEIGLLRRILKKHRLWKRLAEQVEQEEIDLSLHEQSDIGRALEESEQIRLLEVAQTRPSWMVAYCAAVVALNTTMRSKELRNLRWRDVDLFSERPTLRIRRATTKTEAGERRLPLNRYALLAIHQLRERCELAVQVEGCEATEVLPEHYVFPTCENGHVDLRRPMKSWRTAWENLRKAAGLEWLRFHDLRHTCITTLAESSLSDQVIIGIAGQVSKKMLEHYSHIRMAAKKSALEGLERVGWSESTESVGQEEEVESLSI